MNLFKKMKANWLLLICAALLPHISNAQTLIGLTGIIISEEGNFSVEGALKGFIDVPDNNEPTLLQMDFKDKNHEHNHFFLTDGASIFFNNQSSPIDPADVTKYANDLYFHVRQRQVVFTGQIAFDNTSMPIVGVFDKEKTINEGCFDLHIFTSEGEILIDAKSTTCANVAKIPTPFDEK